MKYGKEGTTKFLDDKGSTESVERIYRAGETAKPVRHYFEWQHRIKQDDIATVSTIVSSLLNDASKHDCAIRIERTRNGDQAGYIHLVECYTNLEY